MSWGRAHFCTKYSGAASTISIAACTRLRRLASARTPASRRPRLRFVRDFRLSDIG